MAPDLPCTRRRFLGISAAAGGALLVGCDSVTGPSGPVADPALTARPGGTPSGIKTGYNALELGWARDGFIYVPPSYRADQPAPLLILLHGASHGSADWATKTITDVMDELGIVVLAPDSRAASWDLLFGGAFGPDYRFIDRALQRTFDRCNIDPQRIALAGFSDGASYALSLGVSNGDFLSHLMGFSPGILSAATHRGLPRVFVAHGDLDDVIPVESSRDFIVPGLRNAGYDVTYVEFSGRHWVKASVMRQAMEMFVTGATSTT